MQKLLFPNAGASSVRHVHNRFNVENVWEAFSSISIRRSHEFLEHPPSCMRLVAAKQRLSVWKASPSWVPAIIRRSVRLACCPTVRSN
jgi:hypothetical protein